MFLPSGGGHGGVEVGNDVNVVGDCLFLLELLGIEVLISAEKLILEYIKTTVRSYLLVAAMVE